MYYCLSYAPEPKGEKDELWTPWEQLEDGNLDTKIFRLRPLHTYTVKLWVRTAAGEVSMQDTVQYDVGSSGVWQFDQGPLAKTVFGSPNWNLIMTDYAVGDTPDADNYDAFGGNLVGAPVQPPPDCNPLKLPAGAKGAIGHSEGAIGHGVLP